MGKISGPASRLLNPPLPARDAIGRTARLLLLLLLAPLPSRGQELRVLVRPHPETILTGQGVDLLVDVPAHDRRPDLTPPTIPGARIWIAEAALRPVGMTAIGGATASDNVFTTRLRLVATAPGRIEIPPITAAIDGRSGRSAPIRLTVENPPIAGRPPGFLGGVGDFEATAEIAPKRLRVGQEAIYRIRIKGPSAWGMTTRPATDRLRALPIDLHVTDRPDETIDEPPSRAFVYRLRPMKAGEVVLPAVPIASYDPRLRRYLTRASKGVRLTVVDAPAYDANDLDYRPPPPGFSPWKIFATVAAIAVSAMIVGLLIIRRRLGRWLRRRFPGRRRASRSFARDSARRLGAHDGSDAETARVVLDALIEYARLGADRPPGALTPAEARAAVATASGSDALGARAAETTARCDRILFAARKDDGAWNGGDRLKIDARELFEALGRSSGRRWEISGKNVW